MVDGRVVVFLVEGSHSVLDVPFDPGLFDALNERLGPARRLEVVGAIREFAKRIQCCLTDHLELLDGNLALRKLRAAKLRQQLLDAHCLAFACASKRRYETKKACREEEAADV